MTKTKKENLYEQIVNISCTKNSLCTSIHNMERSPNLSFCHHARRISYLQISLLFLGECFWKLMVTIYVTETYGNSGWMEYFRFPRFDHLVEAQRWYFQKIFPTSWQKCYRPYVRNNDICPPHGSRCFLTFITEITSEPRGSALSYLLAAKSLESICSK